MKVQSRFIEMFGVPANSTKGKRGEELFTFSSGKANIKSNLDPSFQYNCYGGNGITGKSKDYLLKDKTIVIGRVGEYCGCVHKTTDYCWITDNAIYLKTYSDLYRFEFIYHMFTMMDFHRFASETGQPKITQAPLLSCHYPLPSLEEQNKFVAIAEQADKSKFVGFKSRFIEMFGECQRKEKLSSLCETFIDGDWIESKDQSEDGIRLVQTGNVGYGYFKDKEEKSRYISEETFNRLHCTEIFAGDILVSRLPAPIGRACIIPAGIGRMITAVDCSIIRLKDIILQEYFISCTMTSTYSAQINEVTTGTTRRRVSRANLGNVLVPCPSLEAQRQFVAISQQADKSKYYYQIA